LIRALQDPGNRENPSLVAFGGSSISSDAAYRAAESCKPGTTNTLDCAFRRICQLGWILQTGLDMKAILICPSAELRSTFEKTADCFSILHIVKSLDSYPDAAVFRQLVKVWAPDVIFISMEDAEAAGRISKQLDAEFAAMQRVALSTVEDPAIFRFALQLRMAELLVPPFGQDHLTETLKRLAEHLAIHPSSTGTLGKVYAFVPAKGGVGASTIAANAARAFAQAPAANVLLADFDISSGMIGFGFNAEHDYSINDAAKRNKELDEETWQRLVKKVGSIDLLLSGAPMMDDGITARQIPPVLDFARRTYSVIGADLSDTLDERALAVMREANEIFLVTTPDLGALRMARLKILALRRHDWEDKTKLLLNRVSKRMDLNVDEVEATVGLPVYATFPCDYADVTRATRKAEASRKLAPSVRQFVEKLGDTKLPKKRRSRFIERFAVVPARYGFS
jgi:pilus assembly protein CpaE